MVVKQTRLVAMDNEVYEGYDAAHTASIQLTNTQLGGLIARMRA